MEDLRRITNDIIAAAKRGGADRAYCAASEVNVTEFNGLDDRLSLMRTVFSSSMSVSVFKDGRKGSVSTNKLDSSAVDKAVADAIRAADASESDPAWELCPDGGVREFRSGCPDGDMDKLFTRAAELISTVKADFPKIMLESAVISHGTTTSSYRNTSGADYLTVAGYYEVSIMYSAHDGDKSTSFMSSEFITASLDTPFIECASVKSDLESCERQLDSTTVTGSRTGVIVLTPDCLASFLDSVIGCFASDPCILDATSLWKSKLGERVADERVTICFDPTDESIVCPEAFTAEGYLSRPYCFIERGILKSFNLSPYVANKTGGVRADNGGDSLIMAAGVRTLDQIIADIPYGILVGRFSAGQPSASGDFAGVAKNSFKIENGKVTTALSETMISGNLAHILMNVTGISSERVSTGTMTLPYAAFDGVNISGK